MSLCVRRVGSVIDQLCLCACVASDQKLAASVSINPRRMVPAVSFCACVARARALSLLRRCACVCPHIHTFPLTLSQVSLAEFIGAFKHGERGGVEGDGAGAKKRSLANADPIDLDNQERLMHAQQVKEIGSIACRV